MMENEMVERVAKAIFFRGIAPDEMMWKHTQSYHRDIAIEQARAAIEAMRQMTEPMRIAALNSGLPGIGEPPLYEKIWLAAIDAALSTVPPGEEI